MELIIEPTSRLLTRNWMRYQNYGIVKQWGNIFNGKWRTRINLDVLQDYICKVGTDKHSLKLKKLMLRLCGLMEFFKSLFVTELIRLHPNIYKCPHNIDWLHLRDSLAPHADHVHNWIPCLHFQTCSFFFFISVNVTTILMSVSEVWASSCETSFSPYNVYSSCSLSIPPVPSCPFSLPAAWFGPFVVPLQYYIAHRLIS